MRTVAIIERLCEKEEEELVRTKADSKGPDKAWFAEARFKESDTGYFRDFKPVHESAQCETMTKPKARLLLVQGRNLQSLHYTAAVLPMSFCPQAASFDTSILPILSKRKSACIHHPYLHFDQ